MIDWAVLAIQCLHRDATIPADNQSGYLRFRISGMAIKLIADATATLEPDIALNMTQVSHSSKAKPPFDPTH